MDLAGVPGSTDRINISDSDSDSIYFYHQCALLSTTVILFVDDCALLITAVIFFVDNRRPLPEYFHAE